MHKRWLKKGIACCLLASMLSAEVSPALVYAKEAKTEQRQTPLSEEEVEAIKRENTYSLKRTDYSTPADRVHAYDPMEMMNQKEKEKQYREKAEFTDNIVIYKVKQSSKGRSGEVDAVLKKLGVTGSKEILVKENTSKAKNVSKYEIVYRGTVKKNAVWDVVDELEKVDDIVYAEPEFIYRKTAVGMPDKTTDPGMADQWYLDSLDMSGTWSKLSEEGIVPGEDTVVAVIDTGVDYDHEDLKANMWVNTAELNGTPGEDSDGNGYVDDIYGVSTVGETKEHNGDPMDDNGHGTHVAGIIGMTSNNMVGGVGGAYGTKIMAIKAGQSTGEFSSIDIAEAIRYATQMGADVINMSFGGYYKSALMEDALSEAAGSAVLVAAAGNDGMPTSDAPDEFARKDDMYPAAYPYVLGVMAADEKNQLASFSNWDYYNNKNAEYEIIAPGVDIYSTLPGNQYAKWSGTSMAAPMVSAAAAILRSKYTEKEKYSSEFIMGQLSSATQDKVSYTDKGKKGHSYAALNIADSVERLPKPNLVLKNTYLFDSKDIHDANDDDGIADAGETIDLGFVIRNQWGLADDITVEVDAVSEEGVSNTNVEFINDTIQLESIGTFQERNNGFIYDNDYLCGVDTPIRFKIKDTASNDTKIQLNITVTAKNGMDEKDAATYTVKDSIQFMVQRGKVLKGVIDQDMTLTKDNYWIVEDSLRIMEDATVTIAPGTQVQFWSSESEGPYAKKAMAYIQVDGKLLAKGTEEEPVEMFPSAAFQNYSIEIKAFTREEEYEDRVDGEVKLEYANIINLGQSKINSIDHCHIIQQQDSLLYRELFNGEVTTYSVWGGIRIGKVSSSIFKGLSGGTKPLEVEMDAEQTLFDNCSVEFTQYKPSFIDTTFVGNSRGNSGSKNVSIIKEPGKISINQKKPSFVEIYHAGDTKYALMKNFRGWLSGFYGYDVLKCFNKALGTIDGKVTCINSKEKEEEIKNVGTVLLSRMNTSYLELQLGGYRQRSGYWDEVATSKVEWLDGGIYEPEFQGYKESGPIGYTVDLENSYFWANQYSSEQRYLLAEFPSEVSDEQIKSFSYKNMWQIIDKEENGFYNNAILNPLLNLDVSSWMKVSTTSEYPASYNAAYNYWGTNNEKLITAQANDFDSYIGLADIVQSPWLDTPAETTYPHVTEIYLTDMEGNRIKSAGYQKVQVHVTFNRDMDSTKQPVVSFGAAAPYTDYIVEGKFDSKRHWVGTTTISNVLNAGMQYFRVQGGAAAEDRWLTTGTDYMRFAFEVNATNAESLTLQGTGGENRVDLSWMQDEYPTLAGYNVYRSDSEDGEFQKINTRLIPATVRSYTDKEVEAGKTYYYRFTVMDTDLTESRPSNIVAVAPKDNIKPTLQHIKVENAIFGQDIKLSATATDNMKVEYVKAFYRAKGTTEWKGIALSNTSGDDYYGVIKASEIKKNGMEYYIEVSDGTNLTRQGSAANPLQIAVDAKVVVYSVTPSVVTIEGGNTAVITGVNFTDTLKLQVAGKEVPHTFVSEKRLEFVIPEGELGRADIQLVETDGTITTFSNAISYEDETSEIQINEGSLKDGVLKLPVTIDSRGGVKAIDLEVKVDSAIFSNASFEKAEACKDALVETNYQQDGVFRVSMADRQAMKAGQVIGYVVLTPYGVSKKINTTIQLKSGELNGVRANKLVDCMVLLEPEFSVSGSVAYYSNGAQMEGVTLASNVGITESTNVLGAYKLSGITKNTLTITPQFTGKVNGAISAQDSAVVLKTIVGTNELTENQILAADVNGDGVVNAMDASLILQKAVGIIQGNYPGANTEWIFTPQSRKLTLSADADGVDFTGILLGDVTGDWKVAETDLE